MTKSKKPKHSQVWWLLPIIPAFLKHKQRNFELEASLQYYSKTLAISTTPPKSHIVEENCPKFKVEEEREILQGLQHNHKLWLSLIERSEPPGSNTLSTSSILEFLKKSVSVTPFFISLTLL